MIRHAVASTKTLRMCPIGVFVVRGGNQELPLLVPPPHHAFLRFMPGVDRVANGEQPARRGSHPIECGTAMTTTTSSAGFFEPPRDDAVKFYSECVKVTAMVRAAIQSQTPVISVIEGMKDFIYLKASDSTMLVNNSAYENMFANKVTPTGRHSESFLNDTIIPVSKNSDAMILAGADEVMFWHPGRDSDGQLVCFRTFKASLLGLGHPRKAILGISRVVSTAPGDRAIKLLPLSQSWSLFSGLRDREREIAAATARGERTKAIAQRLECSEKTVENSRNAMMKALSLESPAELIKLMVRLQDSGFGDFGL